MKCQKCNRKMTADESVYHQFINVWIRYQMICTACETAMAEANAANGLRKFPPWLSPRPCCRCSRPVFSRSSAAQGHATLSAAATNVGRQFKMPDTAASVRARAQSCSAVVARSCSRRRAGMRSSARPPASSERIGWLALRELLHLCYDLGAAGDADARQD